MSTAPAPRGKVRTASIRGAPYCGHTPGSRRLSGRADSAPATVSQASVDPFSAVSWIHGISKGHEVNEGWEHEWELKGERWGREGGRGAGAGPGQETTLRLGWQSRAAPGSAAGGSADRHPHIHRRDVGPVRPAKRIQTTGKRSSGRPWGR